MGSCTRCGKKSYVLYMKADYSHICPECEDKDREQRRKKQCLEKKDGVFRKKKF